MGQTELNLKHYPAGPNGFFRAPVLITGKNETYLFDGGFTFPDGEALAQAVKQSGKKLAGIYISQSDPDYYFSLTAIKKIFPAVPVTSSQATLDAIQKNVQKKIDTWGPKLGVNGPQSLDQIVLPQARSGDITVDGKTIQVIETKLPNRRYIYSRDLNAIFGGVLVFSDVHVWVADLPSLEQRTQWISILDDMIALKPEQVVPGHMQVDSATDASSLTYTKNYLLKLEEERQKAKDSSALIAAMKAHYPKSGMDVALELGAKVLMNEMKWG